MLRRYGALVLLSVCVSAAGGWLYFLGPLGAEAFGQPPKAVAEEPPP